MKVLGMYNQGDVFITVEEMKDGSFIGEIQGVYVNISTKHYKYRQAAVSKINEVAEWIGLTKRVG